MNPAILRNIKIAAMPTNAIFYGDHEVDSSTSIDDRVASIFNLFEKHGEMNYVGEDVSQLQHAQQVQTKFRSIVWSKYFYTIINLFHYQENLIYTYLGGPTS